MLTSFVGGNWATYCIADGLFKWIGHLKVSEMVISIVIRTCIKQTLTMRFYKKSKLTI